MTHAADVSWVTNAIDTETREVSADKILEAIRTGGKQLRVRVESIRAVMFSANGDLKGAKQEAGELKKRLPAILWSGKFALRKNDALIQHSGLLCADLDGLNGQLPAV